MKKFKNTPKQLDNAKYNFQSAQIKGQKVPKSFWYRMSAKTRLSIIATLAAVTIAYPFVSNAIEKNDYYEIPEYCITMNLEDKDNLGYWLNEYNNSDDKDTKKYIMTHIADYSGEVENYALNSVKEIIVSKMTENPKENDYFYDKVDDISDIRIEYDESEDICIVKEKDSGSILPVQVSKNMKNVVRSVASLQDVTSLNNVDEQLAGKKTLEVLKSVEALNKYNYKGKNDKEGFINKKEILEINQNRIDNDRDDR